MYLMDCCEHLVCHLQLENGHLGILSAFKLNFQGRNRALSVNEFYSTMTDFSDLPDEIQLQILTHATLPTIAAFSRVDRRCNAFVSDDTLWFALCKRHRYEKMDAVFDADTNYQESFRLHHCSFHWDSEFAGDGMIITEDDPELVSFPLNAPDKAFSCRTKVPIAPSGQTYFEMTVYKSKTFYYYFVGVVEDDGSGKVDYNLSMGMLLKHRISCSVLPGQY